VIAVNLAPFALGVAHRSDFVGALTFLFTGFALARTGVVHADERTFSILFEIAVLTNHERYVIALALAFGTSDKASI
jgi:hypothetical protein